jgi:predicted nucleic acid-binding Zn ribbon protein
MSEGEDADAGDEPVPITAALDRVMRGLRGGESRRSVGGVFGRWEEAVGPALAAHVRPIRLERGTLLVEVDDPAWATQLRFLADDVRTRLRETVGVAVDHLEVRVARPGVPPAGDTPLVD